MLVENSGAIPTEKFIPVGVSEGAHVNLPNRIYEESPGEIS